VGRPDLDVLVATGGTGLTARDVTPDALAPLVTKEIPGFGELFRHLSFAEIGAATIQSRAMAALCSGVLVFLLPGSTAGCRLALEAILLPQLDSRTRPCNFATLLPRIRGVVP
jgi:molybdenum cofactor biosynthesis protein B